MTIFQSCAYLSRVFIEHHYEPGMVMEGWRGWDEGWFTTVTMAGTVSALVEPSARWVGGGGD